MKDRISGILALLAEHQRMEVSELAKRLSVSQVTIRKDLDQLESRDIIRREHGWAIVGSCDDINNRLAYHYETKRRIAIAAAALVAPGETVMIESGSCCALLAEELAKRGRDVTIITNSAFISSYIRRLPGARIILLGGDFQNESQVMVGPIVRLCLQNFFVDKLFIGTDGFSKRIGFTSMNHLRAETVRDMAAHAEKQIVLTESSKFSQQGVVSLSPVQSVFAVFTDEGILSADRDFLQHNDVVVHTVAKEISTLHS